jgi:hypothetical protein
MTITLNLPPEIERAFQIDAEARGLSLEEFLRDLLLSNVDQGAVASQNATRSSAQLVHEEGVPVLRTGQPIKVSAVNDTLDRVRRDRERAILGPSN